VEAKAVVWRSPPLIESFSACCLERSQWFLLFSTIVTRLEDPEDLVCPNVLPLKSLDIGGQGGRCRRWCGFDSPYLWWAIGARGSSRSSTSSILSVIASTATNLVADKALVLPHMLCAFHGREAKGVDDHGIRVVSGRSPGGVRRSHRSAPSHDGINALLLSVKFAHLFDPSFEVFLGVLHGEDHSNKLLV
jgi:hypothetical protein